MHLPVRETHHTSEPGRDPSATEGSSFILKAGAGFRYFPELDGFRGSAVLLVVIGHALFFRLHIGQPTGQFAILGVLMFFVLSGFLITGLLCSEEARRNTISLRQFYLRRVFRILPAFIFYILVVILLARFGLVTDISWKAIAVAVLFLRNFYGSGPTLGHLWSLSLEEQFYLVWPIIFKFLGPRRLFAPTLGIILGVELYRGAAILIAPYEYGRGIFELRTDFRIDSILVGCALAIFLNRRKGGPREQFSPRVRWATHPFWVIPALAWWTCYGDAESLRSIFLTVQTALVCCLLFNVIAFQGSVLGRILRAPWLRFTGLISYSLYLWQQPFLVVLNPSWGILRKLPLCLFACGAAALFSYYVIERPFLRMKRRFSTANYSTRPIGG